MTSPSDLESMAESDVEATFDDHERSFAARGLLRLLGLYQVTSVVRRPRCRYIPTCSHYAVEAISLHGASKGTWLAMKRVSRCHPFGSFGFDPVPGSE